ncbi:MAG: MarR family winged helix-turn-helix transcriptional regulator [Tannerellaceae bacterium]|nr:MarR family winged helix-turn-helix transcriptional regulator [Tannerellaceae bacterium]
MERPIEQPDDQLGYLLMQASLLKLCVVNGALKKLNVTYIQFIILAAILELGATETYVTQQLVSSRRRLDKAMVSNVVKSLINKNLIRRTEHPTDHRAVVLTLTGEGVAIAREGKEITKEIDHNFFTKVNRNALQRALKKLLAD